MDVCNSLLRPLAGLALLTSTAVAAETPAITKVLPGSETATGAVFVNVSRIFGLFGAEIEATKEFQQYLEYVDQGAPDPRTDIDAIGAVADLDSDESSAGVAVTGSIDGKALLDLLASQGVSFTRSAYRGVTFHQATDDKADVKIGFPNASVTVLSIVEGGSHVFDTQIVDTVAGRIASIDEAHGVNLPANYLASLSVQMTEKLKALAAGNQFTQPLTATELLTASLTASDARDLDLQILFRMETEEDAVGLEQILNLYISGFGSQAPEQAQEILEAIEITVEGRELTLTLRLPGETLSRSVVAAD